MSQMMQERNGSGRSDQGAGADLTEDAAPGSSPGVLAASILKALPRPLAVVSSGFRIKAGQPLVPSDVRDGRDGTWQAASYSM